MHNLLNKKFLITILAISIIVAGSAFFYVKHININKEKVPSPTSDAKTTSTAPSAQENFSEGDNRGEAGNTLGENAGSATVTDDNGHISNTTDPDKWVSSKAGDITVYSPTSRQLVISGDKISGKTTLDSVSFRIIDSVSGVIATGKLNVVDGKFSGTINFKSNADKGRIDVFGTLNSGKEFSNIEIPVKFK